MISAAKYKEFIEKLGKGEVVTQEEKYQIREYECFLQDQKYGRPHKEGHLTYGVDE